jgi:hypothetical protein
MSIQPPIGTIERPAGELTCGFSPTLDYAGECGQPADWHVMWTVDGANSLCCDPHMADALTKWVFFMRHPISPDCTQPEAEFCEDRCEIPCDCASWAETASRGESP